MNNNVENIILEHLKAIRSAVDITANDIQDLKFRAGNLEATAAQHGVLLASISTRIDKIDERVTRIEKRLDLVEA